MRDRPGFTLDLGRCVGCGACALACRIENGLPTGVIWRRILQVNGSRIDGGPTYHLSVSCHHCETPPCASACPSGALKKTPEGLVLLDTSRCVGCRYCEMACPFGAPAFDAEAGVMTKCHLCQHRLAEGSPPACVVACPTQALGCSIPAGEGGSPGASGRRRDGVEERTPGRGPCPGEDGFLVASGVPGFGDPLGAGPGFWVAQPTGALREEWFRELKTLLGMEGEE
jgi:anaerobic dimethyl sulfoxide reductase subunit B (iron-sulfur subunit)